MEFIRNRDDLNKRINQFDSKQKQKYFQYKELLNFVIENFKKGNLGKNKTEYQSTIQDINETIRLNTDEVSLIVLNEFCLDNDWDEEIYNAMITDDRKEFIDKLKTKLKESKNELIKFIKEFKTKITTVIDNKEDTNQKINKIEDLFVFEKFSNSYIMEFKEWFNSYFKYDYEFDKKQKLFSSCHSADDVLFTVLINHNIDRRKIIKLLEDNN